MPVVRGILNDDGAGPWRIKRQLREDGSLIEKSVDKVA